MQWPQKSKWASSRAVILLDSDSAIRGFNLWSCHLSKKAFSMTTIAERERWKNQAGAFRSLCPEVTHFTFYYKTITGLLPSSRTLRSTVFHMPGRAAEPDIGEYSNAFHSNQTSIQRFPHCCLHLLCAGSLSIQPISSKSWSLSPSVHKNSCWFF